MTVRLLLSLLALLTVLAVAAVAVAQTAVVVHVRTASGGPGEARVTLTPEGGGTSHSCRTTRGTCRIASVPPGRYVVTAEPAGEGRPPEPRAVPIPPSTEVTISVTLR
ncbi:MAG TPA: carboxypeptidase-like regulatory domain-containing protein [Sandaracinaceae bacterium]